jgi:hypothetical protein
MTAMADSRDHLDAHEQPSSALRAKWKAFSRAETLNLLENPEIDDPRSSGQANRFRMAGTIPSARLTQAYDALQVRSGHALLEDVPILYHPLLPGAFQ